MRLVLCAVAALCTFSLVARADTYQLFNLNGTFTNGATLSGQVNLDLNDNAFGPKGFDSIANFTYQLGAQTLSFTGNNSAIGAASPSFTQIGFFDSGGDQVYLYFATPTKGYLAGYNGGVLNQSSDFSPAAGSTYIFLQAGSLSPAAAATPEPSSLALLGTGVVGVAGMLRKRFR